MVLKSVIIEQIPSVLIGTGGDPWISFTTDWIKSAMASAIKVQGRIPDNEPEAEEIELDSKSILWYLPIVERGSFMKSMKSIVLVIPPIRKSLPLPSQISLIAHVEPLFLGHTNHSKAPILCKYGSLTNKTERAFRKGSPNRLASSSVKPPESKSISLDEPPNWTLISANSGEILMLGPIFSPALNFSLLYIKFPKAFFKFADIPTCTIPIKSESSMQLPQPSKSIIEITNRTLTNNGIESKSKSRAKCIWLLLLLNCNS